MIRLNNKRQKDTEFDGLSFVNGLMLIIFISLLIFGSTDIPAAPDIVAFF